MQQHGLAESVACIWLSVWGFRRYYEVDEKLDRSMQLVRWLIVFAAWGLIQVRGPQWGTLRVIAGLIGLGFLCWPNFAFYTVRLFRHGRRSGETETQDLK
jgi:hypothetical protein